MASFSYTFDKTQPVATDAANQLDTFIRDDTKKALAERFALEHQALDAAGAGQDDDSSADAQGRHIPGGVSVLYSGTRANVDSNVSTNSAIGYDTDYKQPVYYTGSVLTRFAAGPGDISSSGLQVQSVNVSAPAEMTDWTQSITLVRDSLIWICFQGQLYGTPLQFVSNNCTVGVGVDSTIYQQFQFTEITTTSNHYPSFTVPKILSAGSYDVKVFAGTSVNWILLSGYLDVVVM